jgi:hypothetical protein
MFIFDVLGGRNSPNLLSALDLNTPHDVELGVPSLFELVSIARTAGFMNRCLLSVVKSVAMREFNEVIGLLDLILTRYQFVNRLKLTL